MKKIFPIIYAIAAILILPNWGAQQESEVAGDRLHRINFYGTVVTVANQDKETRINNISIGNMIKQIPFFVAPTTFSKHINPKERIIKSNPKDILQEIRIDLSETKLIKTKRINGNPVIWKYMDGKKIKREYAELSIVSNDGTKNNYLVEKRKLLRYNEKSPAGPRESKLNFKGLINVKIKGYKDRDLQKNKRRSTG